MLFHPLPLRGQTVFPVEENKEGGNGPSAYATALDQQTPLGPDADLVEVVRTTVRDEDSGAVAGVLWDALTHT